MRLVASVALVTLLVSAGCGPLRSKDAAVSAAESSVGATHVNRVDGKEMTWDDWQRRSGNRGGPTPSPMGETKVWVVALQGDFSKLGPHRPAAAVVILDANTGKMILAETGDWNWPPFWGQL